MNSERGVGPQALSFGDFRLDLRRRVLHTSTGQPVALTSRVLDTLVYMVQHPGVLLARDRLMDSIWPDSYVEPNNLSQNVAKLRRVFAEKPGHNRYIETVPGRGYRFIAEVRSESTPESPSRRSAALYSANGDATRLFRQALRSLQRPTADNCRLAIEQLESALALDSAFAPAWAWLADAHLLSVNAGIASPEILIKAEEQATRGLELDPHLGTAHAVIGTIRCQQGDWLAAESHFMTALAIDGTDSMCRTLHASFLLQQVGHTRRALAQLHEAFALTPDDPRMLMNLAMAHSNLGDDNEALRCARLAVSFGYPERASPLPFIFMHAAARAQRYDEAAASAAPLLAAAEGQSVSELVYRALADHHSRASAIAGIRELTDRSLKVLAGTSGLMVLLIHWLTQLKRVDLAFEVAGRSLDLSEKQGVRPPNWQSLWIPELSPFRTHERFGALAARLGFPRYWETFGAPDSQQLVPR